MNEKVRCPKCNIIIAGHGYEMPSRCVSHIEKKHPEDNKRLVEAKDKLEKIKKEFDGFWFQHYY